MRALWTQRSAPRHAVLAGPQQFHLPSTFFVRSQHLPELSQDGIPVCNCVSHCPAACIRACSGGLTQLAGA